MEIQELVGHQLIIMHCATQIKPNSKLQNPQNPDLHLETEENILREKVQENHLPDDEDMRISSEEQHELYK